MDAQPLDEAGLRELLATIPFVTELHVRGAVGSTNDELRELSAAGAGEGCVVVADRQSSGKGRMGRSWHSPSGLGLYISVCVMPGGKPEEITRWTILASLAACRACRATACCDAGLKWPNDVIFRGLKLGGILAETRSAGPSSERLIIGLGLNVSHGPEDFPAELRGEATSLLQACGSEAPPRERLAAGYLGRLGDLAAALRRGEWSAISAEWERLADGCRGRAVRVLSEPPYEGITDGLDGAGGLRVRREDGTVEVVRTVDRIVPMES
jgi:BirA family biotin operon repressor/biotin-[acetyl-CoA-carboxylase] ligase